MPKWRLWRTGAVAMFAGLVGSDLALCEPAPTPSSGIAPVELSKPFNSRSAWRLVANQRPPAVDYGGNPAPGELHLCLEKGPAGPCTADSSLTPPESGASHNGWEPHYLKVAKPVYPRGRSANPLLMIVTASMHAGDGGQVVVTQLFKYSRTSDKFARVYVHATGTNNNEEVRFIPIGPLKGAVISAEPTDDAPYAYWVEVNRFTPERAYRQVLRYRSATRYNDGNSLAVIDAEMPNIKRRLGLWRPGSPLPLPKGAARRCPRPHLKGAELWCE
jgi:hypothetical protein